MANFKTPPFGSYNRRIPTDSSVENTKDQLIKACIPTKIASAVANSATYYLEKRNGINSVATQDAGKNGCGVFVSPSLGAYISAFATTSGAYPATIYYRLGSNQTNCGVLDGRATTFNETILGGITYILISSNAGTGWFLASDAINLVGYTFTGTTHSNTTMDGITSTAGMYAGQAISGSGIPANTRIQQVVSVNSITLTIAATTSTTATFTREAIAKIIATAFPGNVAAPNNLVGGFAELDGYIFVMTKSGRVFNSDLNSVTSWTAGSFILASISTDSGVGVAKYKNQIMAMGNQSIEFFYNAGNPAGSPLSSSPQLASTVGVAITGQLLTPNVNNTYVYPLYATSNNKVFFVGSDRCLYTMNGFSPDKISEEGLKLQVEYSDGLSAFTLENRPVVAFSNNTYPFNSFWYFVDDKIWTNPNFSAGHHVAGGDLSDPIIVLEDTSGKLGYFSAIAGQIFQDFGVAFSMQFQLQTDMGTNFVKIVRELRVEADNQASGNLAVSYSDDDGATFSTSRNIDMTRQRKRLTRLGSFVGTRIWRFTHSDNTACRIKLLEFDYSVGTR